MGLKCHFGVLILTFQDKTCLRWQDCTKVFEINPSGFPISDKCWKWFPRPSNKESSKTFKGQKSIPITSIFLQPVPLPVIRQQLWMSSQRSGKSNFSAFEGRCRNPHFVPPTPHSASKFRIQFSISSQYMPSFLFSNFASGVLFLFCTSGFFTCFGLHDWFYFITQDFLIISFIRSI